MENAPRTYHSESSFDLSIPEYLPLEETLDHIRDASEAYSAMLTDSFEQFGLGLEVKAPERPFLFEIGTITIVISITFQGAGAIGGGALGLYALKKLIDGLKEVTVSELKARIQRESERQKAELEAQWQPVGVQR